MEIIKWLYASMVNPITNNKWVSLVHCVLKKGGITIIPNEKNELMPMRQVTGWIYYINYQKMDT